MPMREYRGAWVASVGNIDWPSKPGLGVEGMHAEIENALDTAAQLKLNALFLQVRPACDATYLSAIEPTSYYLMGQQGESIPDGFDPLEVWIAGAHARGIELHAWINPFRARPSGATYELGPHHIAVRRPDLVREYDRGLWLDPGEPDAVEHSLRVVDDLVRRYDLDGLHFDDYFYPYPKDGQPFPDDASYAKYEKSGGKLPRETWRRTNIDGFVQRVYDQTRRAKDNVRVSISPFGIWRPGHPAGVAGFDAFEGLSADSRRWLCEGWMDMVVPQLYWKISAAKQPYAELLDWWIKQNECGRLVLAGNYASRINSTPESWHPTEIVNQVLHTRSSQAAGNVHFSLVAMLEDRKGLKQSLCEGVYSEGAVIPETAWLSRGHGKLQRPWVRADVMGSEVQVSWSGHCDDARAVVLNVRRGGQWQTFVLPPRDVETLQVATSRGRVEAVSVSVQDRFGRLTRPRIVRLVGSEVAGRWRD